MDSEVTAAREKLKNSVGDSTRIGGKGSVRRKHKFVHKTQINDDKKLKSLIKKFGCQPFPGIDEVNMFKDDNTIIHFTNPEVMAAYQHNTFVVMGKSETKTVSELLPDIITHLGPKQMNLLKEILEKKRPTKAGGDKIEEDAKEDEDEAPQLEGVNFEEVSKKAD
jgi:nascent polypeptide-associated complex subunit beta